MAPVTDKPRLVTTMLPPRARLPAVERLALLAVRPRSVRLLASDSATLPVAAMLAEAIALAPGSESESAFAVRDAAWMVPPVWVMA